MKYIVMMMGCQAGMADKSAEWIKRMLDFMDKMDRELRESGEAVYSAGLADAPLAKTVGFADGLPVVSDGPYAESKESLAGFWILDVETEARVIDIAAQVAEVIEDRLEIRQVMDQAPEDAGV